MPTFIDRYIALGEQRGWQKGWEKGWQEGWQKGYQEAILLRLMTRKFGTITTEQRQRLAQADSETLLRWLDQVLFAETTDETLL
ncbi:MAG: hypothetical protein ACKN9T_11275 [Candidatus Methylumidiphilus sp.]